jgi:hypothetical protein
VSLGLYSNQVIPALRGPLTFVVSAWAATNASVFIADLDVLGGDLTFDEEWAPYVQATLTVRDPGVIIDPRLAHRLVLRAGYVYPWGASDVQQIAYLAITSAVVDTVANTLTITASSDESLVQMSAHWATADSLMSYGNHTAAVVDMVGRALTSIGAAWASSPVTSTSASMTAPYVIRTGDSWWQHLESVRDMAGAVLWCDETRTWHFDLPVFDDSPSIDAYLATGDAPSTWPNTLDSGLAMPTITSLETAASRDEWANAVALVHTWTDTSGVAHRVAQIAAATTGAYSVSAVGYRVYSEERSTQVTDAEAAAACASILYRTTRRGVRRTITARAAYWLRPRTLAPMWLNGKELYARITRVSYKLDGSGLMTLTTRAPVPQGVEGY